MLSVLYISSVVLFGGLDRLVLSNDDAMTRLEEGGGRGGNVSRTQRCQVARSEPREDDEEQ